ncbi:MAG: hypothetical protein OXR67_11850 [Chloroflexota bacterium]|nr:hypothetical protein [Chloroflexota bacterium]
MAPRVRKLSTALFAGGMVAGSPLIAACGGPSYDSWAATDGAAGRINLDDVQQAFKESKSATDFESRVNEIYEGDGIILIRAQQDGNQLTLEGWEDLNGSNEIEDARDDRLFSIVKNNDQHEMRGYHANSYYHSSFGGGSFLFGYMLATAFMPGPYFYSTPINRGPAIRQSRSTYRQSTRYGSQVARNSRYTTRQQGFAGSRYQDSSRNLSSNRQSYQQTQRSSGAFRSSSSISRSSSGSAFGTRARSGSFSGGGGHMNLRKRQG